jgi:hypothetical protein
MLMSLLDRLKPLPKWKHADPAVRAAAIQALDPSAVEAASVLASIATDDSDARVRRAAVTRLGDPDVVRGFSLVSAPVSVLGRVARQDADESVRQKAIDGLLALALEDRAGRDEAVLARAEAATAALTEPRHLGAVAKDAADERLRRQALDRLGDQKALGSVARHAKDAAIAALAVEKIADPAELVNVALKTEHRNAGLAALERLAAASPEDRQTLAYLAERAAEKAVARRARALVQAIDEAKAARRAADDARRARETEVCEQIERLSSAAASGASAAGQAEWRHAQAALEDAEREWAALGPGAHDDLAARYEAARGAARETIERRAEEERQRLAREAAREAALAPRRALCERLEQLTPGERLQEDLDAARGEWEGLPPAPEWVTDTEALRERFARACAAAERALADRAAAEALRARLLELASAAEEAAALPDLADARARLAAVESERLSTAADDERALSAEPVAQPVAQPFRAADDVTIRARFDAAAARLAAREQERREAEEKKTRDNLRRLERLCERVAKRAAADDLTLREADRAAKELRAAIDETGPLPTKKDREAILDRLRAALAALAPRARELRELDDWKRFANAAVQEELCARTEALLKKLNDSAQPAPEDATSPASAPEARGPGIDLDAVARELREINTKWREAAEAPRAQAQALWHRYRRAYEPIYARCREHFAKQAEARAANLAAKLALCERAEALAESTDWIRTADELRTLQAAWQTIGPTPRDQARPLWLRFRSACNRFFTRRHEDLVKRKELWAANQARKVALCERAEALAESTAWDAAAAELRHFHVEWKTIGPVKRSKAEALWNRFRAACDRFFERYKQRDAIALEARLAAREAAVAGMETLASSLTSELDVQEVRETVRDVRRRWDQAGPVPSDRLAPMEARYADALNRVIQARPDVFRDTELDPDANLKKLEKLCARVERLVADDASQMTSSQALAAMLREALAANTIGGRPSDETRWKAALEEVRQAQAAWKRVGPAPGDAARELTRRFHRACDRVLEQQRRRVPVRS